MILNTEYKWVDSQLEKCGWKISPSDFGLRTNLIKKSDFENDQKRGSQQIELK